MRITSGWLRGLNLQVPKDDSIRPTSARLRGAALNMLQNELGGARILDLYAGSGAVGIEAISRGAKGAVFVESEKAALTCLEKNLAAIRQRSQAQARSAPMPLTLVRTEVAMACRSELRRLGPFDIIWADPPYSIVGEFLSDISSVLRKPLAQSGTVLALEGPSGLDVPESLAPGWILWKNRAHGAGEVTMWRCEGVV